MFAVKIHIAFIGIVLVLTSALSPLLAIWHYQANKELYIINCENKEKPTLHCEGKCQLEKKYQKTTAQENDELRPSMMHPIYYPLVDWASFFAPQVVQVENKTLQHGQYVWIFSSALVLEHWQPPRSIE